MSVSPEIKASLAQLAASAEQLGADKMKLKVLQLFPPGVISDELQMLFARIIALKLD